MNIFVIEEHVMLVISFALLAVKIFAFASALLFEKEAYVAAGKLTKAGWLMILGFGVVAQLVFLQPVNIINLVFTVAAFVYLADVRPALAGLTRR